MKRHWIGITGAALAITGLTLMLIGPRFWPMAFYGNHFDTMSSGMMGGGMMGGDIMGGGMMGGGMMGGGMMGGGMASSDMMHSMMSPEVLGDPAQPFDLRFLDQMIPHHQMAVHSAQMMIANSDRPELRDLAQRIISAQQSEIDQMLEWRSAWFPDAPATPMMGGGMMDGGMMGGGMMGGGMMDGGMMDGGMMGDQAEMDRLFLEMMIPHHEAAIGMAQQTLEESDRPELHALAEAIISSQTAEIAEMRGYLRDFFGTTP